MRVSVYLVIEPTYSYSGKVNGGKAIAVRQSQPQTLVDGSKALQLVMDLPSTFFDPPILVIHSDEVEMPEDTPETVEAKMIQAAAVIEAAREEFMQ